MTMPGVRWWLRVVAALLVRPWLWVTAVATVARLASPRWWRRAPFLPLPDPDYLRFRLETQYGGDGVREPEVEDLVTYLTWCHRTRLR